MSRFLSVTRAAFAVAALPLLLLACSEPDEEVPDLLASSEEHLSTQPVAPALAYTNITPDQMAELMEAGDDYFVVNVHVPDEGEIPGTDEHIPFDEIQAHEDELPGAKDAPIVLYCRSGRMSQIAADTLAAMGYTNLLHLDGGMIAWEEANYPLQETGAAR